LWISSGYDSGTVLHNFVQHNLLIDELCVFQRDESDSEYPLARKIAQDYKDNHNHNVIITDVILGINYAKTLYQDAYNDDFWSFGMGLRIHQTNINAIGDKRYTANNYSDRLDIYGFEKPRVTLHDNKWYAMFPDAAAFDAVNMHAKGFWCDEDCWELYHSACWNVIAWLETLPNLDNKLVHQIQSSDPQYYSDWNLSVGRILVTNSFSKTGLGKTLFKPGMWSPSNVGMNKYFQHYEPKVWDRYVNNLLDLQKIVGKDAWSDVADFFPMSDYAVYSEGKFLRSLVQQR
jgi:hypothetical protein